MTTLIKILVTAFCALLMTSCDFNFVLGKTDGNGNVIEKDLNITESFRDVHAGSGWDIILTKGDEISVVAEVDENLLDILDVYVTGSTLKITTRESNLGRASSKKINVTYTDDLENISVSSGANLIARDRLEGDRMRFDVSSGGSIDAMLTVRNVKAEVSSGGRIKISGGSETVETNVSSGGIIDASDLKAENCIAEASSGGNIKVWAGNSIVAKASSGGNVEYWGNPNKVNTPKSMSGSITKK
tara:strand:- start:26087 stop:26818 length:732 start_codon:yes stop_codon:yes gene_type:complete